MPSLPAFTVPRDSLPLNSSTLLPASAVPSIVGVSILVNAVVVVITGAAGAVVSTSTSTEMDDVFPAASVALMVKV